jgi:hypothetical protein
LVAFAVGAIASVSSVVAEQRTVLWAWQREEELSWIDAEKIEVAALLATLRLSGTHVELTPRRHELRAPKGSVSTGVFRIERARDRAALARTGRLANKRCGGDIGSAVDEPLPPLAASGRKYLFNPRPWTASDRLFLQTAGS